MPDRELGYCERYWGMREPAFSLAPDPRFLYLSGQHQDALNALTLAVTGFRPLGVLVGPNGCGKTSLARKIVRELSPEHYRVSMCTGHGTLPALQSLPGLASAPSGGDPPAGPDAGGGRAVVVVDEAQAAEPSHLTAWLSEAATHPGLTVILVGRQELSELVSRHPGAIACEIGPLSRPDTDAMIRHRLRTAWYAGPELFTDEALAELHSRSAGIPRLVCELAANALAEACNRGQCQVGASSVATVASELSVSSA